MTLLDINDESTVYSQRINILAPVKPRFASPIPSGTFTLGVASTLLTLPAIIDGTHPTAVPLSWDATKFTIARSGLGGAYVVSYTGAYLKTDEEKSKMG